jgi:Family of unknown function (DUF6174)
MAEFPLKHILLITAITISCLVAGCGGEDARNTPPPGYIQAKQTWETGGILNYHFTISQSCYCVSEGPINVVVRGGTLTAATYVNTGLPVGDDRFTRLPTLSGLFALADSGYSQNAASIRFTVNAALGYLEYLYIDYFVDLADEELSYTITGFGRDPA